VTEIESLGLLDGLTTSPCARPGMSSTITISIVRQELRRIGELEQAQESTVLKARGLSHKVLTAAIKKRHLKLKHRYGPRYSKAMLGATFLTFFLPIPGSLLIGVALLVLIAEVHRAISKRGGFAETIADLMVVVKANLPSWATGRWQSPSG
jgi:hypothetical protein